MLLIRLARDTELNDIWALVRRTMLHMKEAGNPQWGSDYPTRAWFAEDIRRGELYLATTADGSFLGTACINTEPCEEYAPLPWRIPSPAVVIHRLAVEPSVRRRGVASAFFDFAEALAPQWDCSAIHVDTYAQNQGMQALLLGRGYTKVGEVHFGGDDRPLAFPCFEKVLSA